mgnify:CR=1 FL=1
MNNKKVQQFSCYKSGIYCGDIIFSLNGVSHRLKPLESGMLPAFSKVTEDDKTYAKSLIEIWQEIWMKGLDNPKYHYERYLKVEEDVGGLIKTGWIFAQMNGKLPVDIVFCEEEIAAFIITGREACTVLVKPGYENFTPIKLWKAGNISKAEYSVNHFGSFEVKMRDDVFLSTDIFLPSGITERIPAILVRTPYGKKLVGEMWKKFSQRGYAVVIQDVRGREDSEGEWLPFAAEIEDGDDTLNWIAMQPWSDGNVGMIGGSYSGYVQWAAAASGNPHLKAIVSLVTAGSPFVDIMRKGGTYASGALAWAFAVSQQKFNPMAMVRDDWDDILSHRPINEIPKLALGRDIKFWSEWTKHEDNDNFWDKCDWTLHSNKINVPSLIISGWFDDDGMGTSQAWDINQRNNRQNMRMILGPWYHQCNTTREIHNIQFGSNSLKYDMDLLHLKWFDCFLKGIDNGMDRENLVEYYMIGENKWKTSSQWPPKEVKAERLYIHSIEDAKSSKGDGWLDLKCPEAEKRDQYIFNPNNAFPYLIDISENECSVPENYKDQELRQDVLIYTSKPLEDDLVIAGDIIAVIYAASSAKDTDWVVRLTDVDEHGNSIRLSDGIIRARYRNSFYKAELLEPGKIEKYEINMTKIACRIKKGHKIRVQITSGAKNLCFPNDNLGSNTCETADTVNATQTVYHNNKFCSHIVLPVLEGNMQKIFK